MLQFHNYVERGFSADILQLIVQFLNDTDMLIGLDRSCAVHQIKKDFVYWLKSVIKSDKLSLINHKRHKIYTLDYFVPATSPLPDHIKALHVKGLDMPTDFPSQLLHYSQNFDCFSMIKLPPTLLTMKGSVPIGKYPNLHTMHLIGDSGDMLLSENFPSLSILSCAYLSQILPASVTNLKLHNHSLQTNIIPDFQLTTLDVMTKSFSFIPRGVTNLNVASYEEFSKFDGYGDRLEQCKYLSLDYYTIDSMVDLPVLEKLDLFQCRWTQTAILPITVTHLFLCICDIPVIPSQVKHLKLSHFYTFQLVTGNCLEVLEVTSFKTTKDIDDFWIFVDKQWGDDSCKNVKIILDGISYENDNHQMLVDATISIRQALAIEHE